MNRILFAIAIIIAPISAISQNAMDALRVSESQISGTARYVSMGGAFTALGGDQTAVTQNPAGIAIYRNNEFSTSLGGEWNNLSSAGVSDSKNSQFNLDNVGVVGSFKTNKTKGILSFNMGLSYNSTNSNSYSYSTANSNIGASFTNYIELLTNGTPGSELSVDDKYNAYYDSNSSWLSILGYQSYLISPYSDDSYIGLFTPGVSSGSSYMQVHQYGYNDDYSISIGANYNDFIYFGAAFGIYDLSLTTDITYSESLSNTEGSYNSDNGEMITSSNYDYTTQYNMRGTGFNGKFGVIVRATNFLRVGASFHTPTYYNITQRMDAYIDNKIGVSSPTESFSTVVSQIIPSVVINTINIRTPWNFQTGLAFVIGGKGIISADYKYTAYNKTKMFDSNGSEYPVENSFYSQYYRGSSMLKLGGEFRATDNFSLRCGYAFEQSAISNDLRDVLVEVPTSGLQTTYSLPGHKSYYSGGMGYRVNAFSFDFAYQYYTQKNDVFAYSPLFFDDAELIPASNSVKLKQQTITFTVSAKF